MFEGMDTSAYGQHGGFVATQDTVDRKPMGRRGGSSWIPVLTKDVHDILPGQDSVRRGAHESSEVTFVGIIRSSDRQLNSAQIDYYVDDSTGPPLLASQLIEDERDGKGIPVPENTYVRVIGKVRTWGTVRSVTAFAVIPLKNLNEMTTHMLEATYCRLFYAKDVINRLGEKGHQKAPMNGATAGNPQLPAASNAYNQPSRGGAAATNMTSGGLTGINGEIHKFLSTATNESGYSLMEVARRFPNLGQNKVKEHLELLSSEGHVYTTVDDDHFRTTDS